MATINFTEDTVIALPTAAAEPVANPRWRGRYPKGVTLLPYWVLRRPPSIGQIVIITSTCNRGIMAKVVSITRNEGSVWFTLESMGRPFGGLVFTKSQEAAPPDMQADFRRKDFRVAITRSETPPPQYTIPKWPERWERNLRRLDESEA